MHIYSTQEAMKHWRYDLQQVYIV